MSDASAIESIERSNLHVPLPSDRVKFEVRNDQSKEQQQKIRQETKEGGTFPKYTEKLGDEVDKLKRNSTSETIRVSDEIGFHKAAEIFSAAIDETKDPWFDYFSRKKLLKCLINKIARHGF